MKALFFSKFYYTRDQISAIKKTQHTKKKNLNKTMHNSKEHKILFGILDHRSMNMTTWQENQLKKPQTFPPCTLQFWMKAYLLLVWKWRDSAH